MLKILRLRRPCCLEVVLVFPGPGAVSVEDMMQRLSEQTDRQQQHHCYEPRVKRLKGDDAGGAAHTAEESQSGTPNQAEGSETKAFPLHRVVFIDSTWNQTSKISTDERLQGTGNYQWLCLFSTASDCRRVNNGLPWVLVGVMSLHSSPRTCALP